MYFLLFACSILMLLPVAFAAPALYAPDRSMIKLYINDPIYYHQDVDTYPTSLNSAEGTVVATSPLITSPSAFFSSHGLSPSASHPEVPARGCQHYRDRMATVEKWLRLVYRRWLNQATMFVDGGGTSEEPSHP